jgi:hypothetical protein
MGLTVSTENAVLAGEERSVKLETEARAVLAGGERSVIVKASAALLKFFNTKGATVLRAVSSEFRDDIAAFPWDDQAHTAITGTNIVRWLACFPDTRAANFTDTTVPAEVFVHLRDIVKLSMARSCYPVLAFFTENYSNLTF